ncbi:MAG TPA: cytochrome c oxidase subunit II [Thermoanaerobaculia bacterium]|nr:cytochrome c oxidase subunit II [Thermoanaerobaculia bacterium]
MIDDFPLFPESASTVSGSVDALYFFLIAVCGFVSLVVIILIIFFAVRYRRTADNQIPVEYKEPKALEIGWIIAPLFPMMIMFLWGAKVYFTIARPPDNALEVYATARQWMWKFQHVGGQSEINELHVPVNRAVKVLAASEDVIHDFYVPAFRVKTDVLPNRYSTTWFQATKTGRYHLFCAEYCGTQHSGMIGWVTVMEPAAYQQWLAGGVTEGTPGALGKVLFEKYACNSCHNAESGSRGPALDGVFGKPVSLRGGAIVRRDENYLRESILNPQAKIVEGFEPIMPTFKGQVNEAELIQLIAYIKSLGASTEGGGPATPAKGVDGATAPAATAQPGSAASPSLPAVQPGVAPAPDARGSASGVGTEGSGSSVVREAKRP